MQDEMLFWAHLPLRVGHVSLVFQGRQILVSRKATLYERGMPEHCLTCMHGTGRSGGARAVAGPPPDVLHELSYSVRGAWSECPGPSRDMSSWQGPC